MRKYQQAKGQFERAIAYLRNCRWGQLSDEDLSKLYTLYGQACRSANELLACLAAYNTALSYMSSDVELVKKIENLEDTIARIRASHQEVR